MNKDDNRDKVVSTRRQKDAFCMVNEKYRNILSRQMQKDQVEVKRMVFEEALKQVEGITKNSYLSALRDIVLNRLVSNVKFCKDCINLSLNPFAVAQNVAISGKSKWRKFYHLE